MTNQKKEYFDRVQNFAEHNSEAEESCHKYPGSRELDKKCKTGNIPCIDNTKLTQATNKKLTELRKLFGKNLAGIRKKAGYSQLALSIDIDMTHNFINELEQGNKGASFLTLSKLSVILRVPVHEFFEPIERQFAFNSNDFQYSDPIDQMVSQLHETIDIWNDKRTK
jgi:transcriptional regulator with XRE-family HTH domain